MAVSQESQRLLRTRRGKRRVCPSGRPADGERKTWSRKKEREKYHTHATTAAIDKQRAEPCCAGKGNTGTEAMTKYNEPVDFIWVILV